MALDLSASLQEVASVGEDASKALAGFAHRAIDDLCGRPVNFSKEYSGVKRAHDVALALQGLVRTKFAKNLNEEEFVARFNEQSGVPAKVAKVVATAVVSREAEIKKQLVEHLVNISSSHMTDFDWSLQLTMATSHLSQVRTPILILTIYTVWLDGSSHEYTFEMTKDDVDKVLVSFGKIATEIRNATEY